MYHGPGDEGATYHEGLMAKAHQIIFELLWGRLT